MTFNEVIGQDECKERLLQMVDEGRLPHAIMLCGPAGIGKLALATAFGCHLLNRPATASASFPAKDAPTAPGGFPAGSPEPPMLKNLAHPDLHFTYPTIKLSSMSADHKPVSDDFAREWHHLVTTQGLYISMDQWLAAIGAENQQAIITAGESDDLVRKLSLKSSQGGYKVSIIWLPERMNGESANKLLKLIEEPPQQTVFIMVCEQPHMLLETIRSRVQRIDVKPLPTDVIRNALVQQRGIDEQQAIRVARLANGSWLKALQELQAGTENEQFLDLFIMVMRQVYLRDVKGMKAWTETLASFGREKQKRFLAYTLRMLRESFMFNFQQQDLNYMTLQEENFANKFARFINEANILEFNELINLAIRDIGQNANAKFVFFHLALQMAVLIRQTP